MLQRQLGLLKPLVELSLRMVQLVGLVHLLMREWQMIPKKLLRLLVKLLRLLKKPRRLSTFLKSSTLWNPGQSRVMFKAPLRLCNNLAASSLRVEIMVGSAKILTSVWQMIQRISRRLLRVSPKLQLLRKISLT